MQVESDLLGKSTSLVGLLTIASFMRPWAQKLIAAWGVAWVSLLLGRAIARLLTAGARTVAPTGLMTDGQKALYIGWLVLNAYLEGYRGFQLKFFAEGGLARRLPRTESATAVVRTWRFRFA